MLERGKLGARLEIRSELFECSEPESESEPEPEPRSESESGSIDFRALTWSR